MRRDALTNLRALRLRASLSQRDLGERAGISGQQVLRLEKGQAVAWPSTARNLAAALGVHPDLLYAPPGTPTARRATRGGATAEQAA